MNYFVKPVAEVLPLYYINNGEVQIIYPCIENANEYSRSHKNQDEWWKVAEENGKLGEDIILKYLRSRYQNVEKVKDYEGYDFKVREKELIYRIEVKTVQDTSNPIYITTNELSKANQYHEEYYIYLVVANKKKKNAIIYIIQNPIKTLRIDIDMVNSIQDEEFCTIEKKVLRIYFKEEFYISRQITKLNSAF